MSACQAQELDVLQQRLQADGFMVLTDFLSQDQVVALQQVQVLKPPEHHASRRDWDACAERPLLCRKQTLF